MEKEPSHEASNLIIKTFVVGEDVSHREGPRQRQKKQMAHQTIRELSTNPNFTALAVTAPRVRSAQGHADSAPIPSDAPAGSRSSTSSTAADAANFARDEADKLSTPKDLAAPLTTVLDLLTDSAAPSALPQPLGFQISRKGRQIAVYNATHVHLLDTEALPRAFVRTLEVKRRPVALDMLDDGTLLLLLDTPTVLNVYKMNGGTGDSVEKKCGVDLQHESKLVAISPDGLVVAAGHRFGIELIALSNNAKRLVSVDRMDYLSFSDDSRTLLATTRANKPGSSTTVSVADPFDEPISLDGLPAPIEVDRAWTTKILFPEKAKTCRHAAILPELLCGSASALFAFNTTDATWGIYNLDASAFVYTKEFLPSMATWMRTEVIEGATPAISPYANYVAIAVKQQGHPEIWVYKLPCNYEEELLHSQSEDSEGKNSLLRPCLRLPLPRERNLISQEVSALRWLKLPHMDNVERLVAIGSTVKTSDSTDSAMPELSQNSTATGVIVVMDFDKNGQPIQGAISPQKIVFDLDSLLPGEKLPEDEVVFEREVELLRRRTVAQRQAADIAATRRSGHQSSPGVRSASTRSQPGGRYFPGDMPPVPSLPEEDRLDADEAAVAFEEPYAHAQPRSQASLNRAATVAASSTAARRHLRALPNLPLEYRRADGLRQIPHESDADNWVPPPPPYTPNPGPSDAGIVASTPAVRAPGAPRFPSAGHPPLSLVIPNSPLRRGSAATIPAPAQSPTPPSTIRRPSLPPLSSIVPPRRPVQASPRNPGRDMATPAALQPRSTFPRVSPPALNSAVNMVPDASGTGLRRSSSTFPQPSELRPPRTRGPSTRGSGSRPTLQVQTALAPPQPHVNPRFSQVSSYGGPTSAPVGHRGGNRELSAYFESARAASAVDLRPQRPAQKKKQEKKGLKCIIM